MLAELMGLVHRSTVKDLTLKINVTSGGFTMGLHDKNGVRGSTVSGLHSAAARDVDFDSLDGQARFILVQEAARSLRCRDE